MRPTQPILKRIRGSLEARALVANFLPAAVVTVFVLALISIALIVHFRAIQSEIELRALSIAESVAIQAELPVFVGNNAELDRITSSAASVDSVLYASIETIDGKPISVATRHGFEVAEIAARSQGDTTPKQYDGPLSEIPIIDVLQPVTTLAEQEFSDLGGYGEQTRTIGQVRIGISVEHYEQLLRRGLWSMAVLGFVSLALILAVQFWQLRRILAPLKVLTGVTQSVAMGDLDCKADVPGNDEVALLATAFNDMVEKVKVSRSNLMNAVEEAQSASRLKSQFLANMSHEIRTPLNGIIGLTEQMLETDLPKDATEQLRLVSTSAHALLHVLNDIVDLSRVESGKLQLERRPFDVADEFEQVARLLAPQAHAKRLELACLVVPDAFPKLMGDAHRIRQILTNLVANAIKFTEAGHVAMHLNASTVAENRYKLSFTVTDTGIGIPTDKLEAIFEPFTQADGSFTRKHGGNGLGLAICKQLVTLMGGIIGVTSEPGKGAEFVVSMELEAEPAACGSDEPRVPGQPPLRQPATALLITAAECTRSTATAFISHAAMRVISVPSIAEVPSIMRRSPGSEGAVDVVFFDSAFQGGEAFRTVERIRGESSRQVPIVMLSTPGEVAALPPDVRKLADRILFKPLTRSEVRDVVYEMLHLESGKKHQPETTAGATIPASSASLSILLAEDNPVNQKVAATLVKSCGHRVQIVPDGHEAVEAWRKGDFDVVLMDVQMPNMDGLQATRAIRAEENGSGRHIPIVALTAHALVGDREVCLEAGMDDYLTKPIRRADLEQVLASIGQPVS